MNKLTLGIFVVLVVNVIGVRRQPPLVKAFGASATGSASTRAPRTYTTHFPLAENPISEGDIWEGGKTLGLDWADVATIPVRAFGLESGVKGYDDATALLSGNWGPNQTAEAAVYTVNQNDKISEEVELRLRSSLSAHNATGYEVLFRCSKTNNAYTEIVRWNRIRQTTGRTSSMRGAGKQWIRHR